MASTAVAQDGQKHATTSSKLEDQAALAALYVTKYDATSKNGQAFLDSHHKLSSAGAAASLKYASPADLPSYPSTGLKKGSGDSAAGAAASLGWANQKSFEHWKPDPSASASAAAMMAKDYKMKDSWQPEQSMNGAKAALLAAKDGGKVEIWKPEADSPWGNSAASQAFKKFGAGTLSPVLDYGYTDLGRKGSLMAATGAMSQSRQRAISNPYPKPKLETYPDEANAITNALSAASSASKSKKRNEVSATGAVPYTTMPREMYTSNPPVAPEVNEKNRQDTLHASAVAMARQIFSVQQKQIEQTSYAQRGAAAAHNRKSSASDISDEVQPMRLNNLQEAAQKLAHERLAKLHDEHAQNREYRNYYASNSRPASRLSIRGRTRRRASSDGGLDDDKEQSNKIRAQMSLFSSNLSQVDEKKRAKDREALIAAAQRNVTKSLHGMDEKVFADTGKVAPSLLSEWEVKAHAAAQAKSDTRMENYGKVHIGGGKYIDQSEVDAVARSNVQPVLDEINEKAAAQRERQAAIKAEQEENARKASEKKQREKESKAINKKLKQQDKEEEKLRLKEEKEEQRAGERAAKEKRKSGTAGVVSVPEETTTEPTATSAIGETEDANEATAANEAEEPTTNASPEAPVAIRTSMEDQASLRMQENADAANPNESTPLSPGSGSSEGKGKRMSWLKNKFSKRLSKSQKGSSSSGEKEAGKEEKGFIGGASLTSASPNKTTAVLGAGSASTGTADNVTELETVPAAETSATANKTVPDADTSATLNPATRFEEPAILPGAHEAQEPILTDDEDERIGRIAHRKEEVSPISSAEDERKDFEESAKADDEDEFQEARDNFDEDLAPPPTFPTAKSSSPARGAKFTEAID